MISQSGIIIRMHVEDIAVQSRYGGGVRVMRLGEEDKVVTVARVERSDEEETVKPEAPLPEDDLTDEQEIARLEAQEAAEQAQIEEIERENEGTQE